ncbi:MAG: hypothetical protein RBT02_02090 [Bacteroidales bacterium]|jgi:hypothetical protein|nr:hypothetical protein [Bacteroidales bacterium]
MMKLWLIPALAVMLLFTGCDGKDQQNSGTITLTNELYDADPYYYALGLSFDEAKAVPTLPDQYRADIWLMAGSVTTGGPVVAYLTINTLNPSFALTGTYGSAGEAITAFDGMKSIGAVSYIDLAAPLEPNQVWVIRTRDFKYAKIRIIEVVLDTAANPDFASCKLEWVWQPDGSATFP